ncbi:MAG: DNA polymerase III subunit delta' [Lachnospiraceae bacterium]|nr:DNA polymerase III subunit delta' [Lachnospiraceae bacterium]
MLGFEDILGHDQIKDYFKNALERHQVSHAYILTGEAGMGRKTLANAFAMALQCGDEDARACGSCHSCRQFMSGNHPDVVYVRHEKPGSIGVDDVRGQIINDVFIKPYSSPYKIYIVDQAELLTIAAQNALLKTIEEPPEYVVLFLLTTNSESFLPTILSRCTILKLKPLYDQVIKTYLKEHKKVSDHQADVCAAFARGNLGKAIALSSSEEFLRMQEMVLDLVTHVQEMEVREMLVSLREMKEANLNFEECLDFMQLWYRDVLMFKATKDTSMFIFKDEYRYIKELADHSSFDGIEKILKAIDKASLRLSANVNFEVAMELMLLVMKENFV